MDWKPTYKTPPGRNIASTSRISFPKLGRITFENASTFTLGSSFVEDCNINIQHVKEKTNTETVITTKYVDLIKQLHVQLPRTLRQLHDGQPTLNAC